MKGMSFFCKFFTGDTKTQMALLDEILDHSWMNKYFFLTQINNSEFHIGPPKTPF